MKILRVLFLFWSVSSFSQTPCEDGKAGSYDCLGIDLQSRVSVLDLGAEELDGRWLNDIWGWVDPETNREYALVGMTNGTSFVNISDPANPVVLGVLIEHNSQNSSANQTLHDGAKSVWRDIKVYQNHAYIVSEDPGHGLQVFDLTELRDVASPSKDNQFAEAGHYAGIGKAHNIVINEETGFAYAVGFNTNDGSTCSVGGLHIIDLSDPKNPTFAGCFDDDGYTHDAQCVIYQGPDPDHQGKEICFNSNEEDVVVVDVTNKNDITLISKNGYEGARYVHQGWLTPDHRYFLSNDELDEVQLSQKTRTFIWDMEDLDAPKFLGYYEHEDNAIDHNLYTLNQYVFEANYTKGLRVLDTAGISNGTLKEVAYFDTYVSNDATTFDGAWSNYPYFPSGNIVICDITNGLFVLKMQSVFISEQPQDVTACVGEHLDIPLVAFGDDLSYQWQINDGSGFKNIENFERYKNTQTTTMHAHTLELSQSGNQYRCVVTKGMDEVISHPITLTVIDSPRADFSYNITSITGDITFENNSINAEEFVWNFGDGMFSSVENPSHSFAGDGIFDVMLIASNECTSDTTIQSLELVVAGLEEARFDTYPSVVRESLTIESQHYGSFEVQIYSMQGKRVLFKSIQNNRAQLSMSNFPEGMYVLNIKAGNTLISRKFLVSR
ncbi:choice-of-anchor B family protein [Ekhidna sp.]|uniref:choice-of-anchor B family protein n=1 Tax=Ekhidna sp. TaxID=2608089 RepID=UPI003CCBB2B8